MTNRPPRSAVLVSALALASLLGCAPATTKPSEAAAALAPFAHDAVTAAHAIRIDFGSKIELVGYDVTPEGTAGPGASAHLTLYWRRTGNLDPGWQLFTHLENDRNQNIANLDRMGEFRGALADKPEGVELLELGKIYTDEQTFPMPKAEDLTPQVSVVVGVWNNDMRLPVVSGPTNGEAAGLVTHFVTGVPARRARAGS